MNNKKIHSLVLACCSTCFGINVSNGFDYPVGKPYTTEALDGDGYHVDSDGEFRAQNSKGNYHTGEDWNGDNGGNTDFGDPVYAVSNGTIISAKDEGPGWGNVIIIEHQLPDGTVVKSLYAHLSSVLKYHGDVLRRELIGTIGRGSYNPLTGDYDYPAHLHFEIRTDVAIGLGHGWVANTTGWVNPSDFIDARRQLSSTDTIYSHLSDNTGSIHLPPAIAYKTSVQIGQFTIPNDGKTRLIDDGRMQITARTTSQYQNCLDGSSIYILITNTLDFTTSDWLVGVVIPTPPFVDNQYKTFTEKVYRQLTNFEYELGRTYYVSLMSSCTGAESDVVSDEAGKMFYGYITAK